MNRSTRSSPAERVPGMGFVESYGSIALAILTLFLIGLCAYLVLPYLPALSWGLALAVIAWPLHARASRYVTRRGLASLFTTAVVLVTIVIPGLVFV